MIGTVQDEDGNPYTGELDADQLAAIAGKTLTVYGPLFKTQSLVLKGKWFDMIALGQKKEEYRDVTKYWQTRIHNWHERARMAGMPMVMEFRLGYAARAQRTAFLLAGGFGVRGKFRFPHPDWGEPNEKHFVLPLGERVKLVGDAE